MDAQKRAEIKRTYKETQRPAGVYAIRNTVTGKVFIGSSVDVPARINRHKAEFSFGSGENRELLADVKKYGADSFEFEILETLDGEYTSEQALADDVKLLEQMWLDKCRPYGEQGYNRQDSQRL